MTNETTQVTISYDPRYISGDEINMWACQVNDKHGNELLVGYQKNDDGTTKIEPWYSVEFNDGDLLTDESASQARRTNKTLSDMLSQAHNTIFTDNWENTEQYEIQKSTVIIYLDTTYVIATIEDNDGYEMTQLVYSNNRLGGDLIDDGGDFEDIFDADNQAEILKRLHSVSE